MRSVHAYPFASSLPRGTNVVPRGGILPTMVTVLPIAGLVASSSAQRLKPRGIDIRVNIDPVHWF